MTGDTRDRRARPTSPIAIGGVGGSGTRVVASILEALGLHLGRDLNESLDNLWFTLLFKDRRTLEYSDRRFRRLVRIFSDAMRQRPRLSWWDRWLLRSLSRDDRIGHSGTWLRERARSIRQAAGKPGTAGQRWGWKEPNTHVFIDRLARCIPNLRYLHVVRNGLDMAFSRNQQQLELWGPRCLGVDCSTPTPRLSLKYWRTVHERILTLQQNTDLPILIVPFDRLVLEPEVWIERIADFCHLALKRSQLAGITAWIHAPKSTGRFRNFPLEQFDPADLDYVRRTGFDTE